MANMAGIHLESCSLYPPIPQKQPCGTMLDCLPREKEYLISPSKAENRVLPSWAVPRKNHLGHSQFQSWQCGILTLFPLYRFPVLQTVVAFLGRQKDKIPVSNRKMGKSIS